MIEEKDDGKDRHIFRVIFGTSQLHHGPLYWGLRNLLSNGLKLPDRFGFD